MTVRALVAVAIAVAALASLNGCALATTAVSSFQSQQQAAANASVKSDLADAEIALAEYATANSGSVSGATASLLVQFGFTPVKTTKRFEVHAGSGDLDTACIQASTPSGTTFREIDADGVITQGNCPAASD